MVVVLVRASDSLTTVLRVVELRALCVTWKHPPSWGMIEWAHTLWW